MPGQPLGTDGVQDPHGGDLVTTARFSRHRGRRMAQRVPAATSTDWIMAHNEFIRKGYAHVGVSAGRGRNNLETMPRYVVGAQVTVTRTTSSGRSERVRNSATVLGRLPQHILATGESQSASRLVITSTRSSARPRVRRFHGAQPGAGGWLSQSPLLLDERPVAGTYS
jgi:hypothetical protein